MKSQNETSDKNIIFRYHKKPTVDESIENNMYCKYHFPAVRKIQVGRFMVCPICKGKPKSLPSGKPFR
jgi:hypothetical protein